MIYEEYNDTLDRFEGVMDYIIKRTFVPQKSRYNHLVIMNTNPIREFYLSYLHWKDLLVNRSDSKVSDDILINRIKSSIKDILYCVSPIPTIEHSLNKDIPTSELLQFDEATITRIRINMYGMTVESLMNQILGGMKHNDEK